MENDLQLKSKAVDQLQEYLVELQSTKEKYETLKDENINLITQLEESMQRGNQLEQSSQRYEQDYQAKIKQIEVELQKYVMGKQQENQNMLEQADKHLAKIEAEKKQLTHQVETMKQQNGEITHELVAATQQTAQLKNEMKGMKFGVKEAGQIAQELQDELKRKDSEI